MFEYGNVIGRFAVLKRKRAFYASRGIFSRRQNSTLQHSKDDQNIDASIDRTQERIAFTAVAAEFDRCERRDVDYVILWKVDRFARNRRDDANMLFEINTAGAKLVSATENIDETPAGALYAEELLKAFPAQDAAGKEFEMRGEGLLARAFCHEIDHLKGILFLTHLSMLKRDLIKRKIRKLKKAGEW